MESMDLLFYITALSYLVASVLYLAGMVGKKRFPAVSDAGFC